MDNIAIKLECMRIVYPKSDISAVADVEHFTAKAQMVYEFVTKGVNLPVKKPVGRPKGSTNKRQ